MYLYCRWHRDGLIHSDANVRMSTSLLIAISIWQARVGKVAVFSVSIRQRSTGTHANNAAQVRMGQHVPTCAHMQIVVTHVGHTGAPLALSDSNVLTRLEVCGCMRRMHVCVCVHECCASVPWPGLP